MSNTSGSEVSSEEANVPRSPLPNFSGGRATFEVSSEEAGSPLPNIIHNRFDYHHVVFGNTTFLINPKIHFHSDNSMIIMDISGEEYVPGKGAESLCSTNSEGDLRSPDEFEHHAVISTIDISGQHIHSYHDISGQHIHTYPDISGLHIHPYMDNSGLYIHPYHDVTGWHLPYYRDVSSVAYGLHIYPYHDAWGWHMLPSDLSTNDVSQNSPNFSGGRATYEVSSEEATRNVSPLSRDIGWHIHPHDGSTNIIYDTSGWHFKPPPTRTTVLHVKTADASLNWYYFHHGHPIDLSMTDISGIHQTQKVASLPDELVVLGGQRPLCEGYKERKPSDQKSIHIYQYDYPYPSSTLFPVSNDHHHHHHHSISDYFNELIHDTHKIILGDVPPIFEFPTDFIPDVSIPSICTYTNVYDTSNSSGSILQHTSTTIIDMNSSETMFQIDHTTTDIDSEGNIAHQITCDISAIIIDISGSEPILQIENTITEIDSESKIIHYSSCDISATVIDISGSEPMLNVDITDISGNHSSYDISASNIEYDASGILKSSTYTIDCSTNSIQVMLSDFGNNLPPYVVYICDVCAKAKLSTPNSSGSEATF